MTKIIFISLFLLANNVQASAGAAELVGTYRCGVRTGVGELRAFYYMIKEISSGKKIEIAPEHAIDVEVSSGDAGLVLRVNNTKTEMAQGLKTDLLVQEHLISSTQADERSVTAQKDGTWLRVGDSVTMYMSDRWGTSIHLTLESKQRGGKCVRL